MLKKLLATLLFTVVGIACAQGAVVQPYVLSDTEVRSIHSAVLQRDYELFISLPAGYATSKRSYPVLFVTDANYAFPVIRSIARRTGNHGKKIDDFILIGLSYGKGETSEYSRRRDYTPTSHAEAMVSDMQGREAKFGEADGYRRFIADEVFPFIAKTYRADMNHKIYAGHSYGGLFGINILLTTPTMFEYYILGSPSLWFNRKVMFKREQAYAATHKDLPAKVYFAVGSFETINVKSNNPRYLAHSDEDDDAVRDIRVFTSALKSHHYPGLNIKTGVIEDEDHLTVFPAIITRGMQWALPPKRQAQ